MSADLKIVDIKAYPTSFGQGGIEEVGGAPEGFGALLRKEVATWAKVVKDAYIKVD